MKILNVQISLSGGGAEKVTELLEPEIKLTGHSYLRVACIGESSSETNTHVLTKSDSLFSRVFLAPYRLSKIIDTTKPEIIHIHCERPEFTFVIASFIPSFLKKKHRPKVFVTEHTSRPWSNSPALGAIVRKQLTRLKAQWYTCIEEDLTKTFVPNPVQRLNPLKEGNSSKRAFFIGRLVSGKRVDLIIEAIGQIGIKAELLIIGDGPERERLQTLAKRNPNIRFTGALASPWDKIEQGDLYVSASEYEGSPLALLEALSLGVDVLASDIPAHRKLLPQSSLYTCPEDLRQKLLIKLLNVDAMLPHGDKLAIEELVNSRRPRIVAELWVAEYTKAIRGFE